MSIETPLNKLLRIQFPILLAAMDLVADARLTLAVSNAGGFGILGVGYGDANWLERELAFLKKAQASQPMPFGIGFITWCLARQPRLLEQALAIRPDAVWLSFGDPAPFVERIKAAGALVICQVQTEAMAKDAVMKGAAIIVAQGAEAGGHGVCTRRPISGSCCSRRGRPQGSSRVGGWSSGWARFGSSPHAWRAGRCPGHTVLRLRRSAGHEEAKGRIVSASGDDTLRSIIFDISRRAYACALTGRCLENDHSQVGRAARSTVRQTPEEADRYQVAPDAGDFNVAAVIAGEVVSLCAIYRQRLRSCSAL